MGNEWTFTKKQAKKMFNEFVDGLKEKDIVYISKILCGSVNASKKENSYMQIGFGVNPHLFKDKGKSIRGLMNSNILLVVVPKKEFLNPEVVGGKDE